MTGSLIPHFGLVRQYDNLKEELLAASDAALREGCWVDGPYAKTFETWLQVRTDNDFVLMVHSGTQALEMLAKYAAWDYNEMFNEAPSVYIPNITYPATLNAFLKVGFNVELVDTDRCGLLDSSLIGDTPSAYLCQVGLYGARPSTLDINTRSLDTIIDGAQHWLVAESTHASLGMAISFDPTKNLPSSGNGGAIVTSDRGFYDWAVSYRNNGKPDHEIAGTNSKMSEQDCAHLLVRAKYIDQWQNRRKQIRNYYIDRFKDLPNLRCLSSGFEKHADQKFVIYSYERDELAGYLNAKGIETKIHYDYTLGELPLAARLKKPTFVSTSWMLTRGILSLPIYPELTDAEIEYIADCVNLFYMTSSSPSSTSASVYKAVAQRLM